MFTYCQLCFVILTPSSLTLGVPHPLWFALILEENDQYHTLIITLSTANDKGAPSNRTNLWQEFIKQLTRVDPYIDTYFVPRPLLSTLHYVIKCP